MPLAFAIPLIHTKRPFSFYPHPQNDSPSPGIDDGLDHYCTMRRDRSASGPFGGHQFQGPVTLPNAMSTYWK